MLKRTIQKKPYQFKLVVIHKVQSLEEKIFVHIILHFFSEIIFSFSINRGIQLVRNIHYLEM